MAFESVRTHFIQNIFTDLDHLMELLKKQLDKNPNSRISDDNYSNNKYKQNKYNNHNNSNRNHLEEKEDNYHNKKKRKKRKQLPNNIYMSKRLSFYLRHGAEKAGLKIRNDGFVKLNSILKLNEFKQKNATFESIKQIVDTNDKKRFSMKNESNIWFIRANQGHSIKSINSSSLLNEITINEINQFPIVCHGTYLKAWNIIKNEGLKKMNRNHIHFVPSDNMNGQNVISGMRSNCQILIYIDLEKALNDGIKFFVSDNNVILSEGLNGILQTKYFKKASTFENGNAAKTIWENNKTENDQQQQKQSMSIDNNNLNGNDI